MWGGGEASEGQREREREGDDIKTTGSTPAALTGTAGNICRKTSLQKKDWWRRREEERKKEGSSSRSSQNPSPHPYIHPLLHHRLLT